MGYDHRQLNETTFQDPPIPFSHPQGRAVAKDANPLCSEIHDLISFPHQV